MIRDEKCDLSPFAGCIFGMNERTSERRRRNRNEDDIERKYSASYRTASRGLVHISHQAQTRQKECNKKNDTYPSFLYTRCYEEANATIGAHYTNNGVGRDKVQSLYTSLHTYTYTHRVYVTNNELIFSCFLRLFPPS